MWTAAKSGPAVDMTDHTDIGAVTLPDQASYYNFDLLRGPFADR
jgi:hypothetical protein